MFSLFSLALICKGFASRFCDTSESTVSSAVLSGQCLNVFLPPEIFFFLRYAFLVKIHWKLGNWKDNYQNVFNFPFNMIIRTLFIPVKRK